MGWSARRRATAVAAVLACAGALGLVVAGGERGAEAAARPTLQIVSFTADSTIRPGRTTSATVFCRRGFALLGSRFRPISVNPANARPVFETVAVIPRPKGATFAFRNTGTATLQIRATADCTRIAGRPSLRTTVARRAFRFGGAAAAEAGRARTSARRGLGVVCRRPNSIPADIGFDARSSDLRRLRFFVNRRGQIGLRGVFTGRPGGRGELLLSCVQGRGVRMVGRVAGGGRSGARQAAAQADGRAQAAARRPAIVVRYFRTAMRPRPGLPFGGMLAGVDRKRRVPWGSPMPSVSPAGFALTARGFLAGLRASSSAIVPTGSDDDGQRRPNPLNFFAWGSDSTPLSPEELSRMLAKGSELNRVFLLAFVDKRLQDEVKQQHEEEGGPPPESELGSKINGPFENLPDCHPGFFIDIFIDADAREPIEHRILDNDPPCENATVKISKFDAGVEPPNTAEGETRWQSHKTYRVSISGDPGPPKPFRIAVTWFKG